MSPHATAREKLAADLHGEHKHAFGGITHPERNVMAWDTLPSRQQDRWHALVDWLMEPATLKRINGIAGREKRDANGT